MDSPTPALPPDVWSIIARHIDSHKEWAKACGTCRATFGVQLARVRAIPRSLQELRWFANRWRFARVISFHYAVRYGDALVCGPDMAAGSMLAEQDAIMASSPAGSFGNLRQIGVSVETALPEWFSIILSRAGNLQLLKLESISTCLLPIMCRLKHLMLNTKLKKGFCTRVGELTCMETLHISYTDMSWAYRGEHDAQMPALDLRACPQLRAVSFEHIVPVALELPPGCTTHISSTAHLCLKAWDSWQRASSGIIDASRSPYAQDALAQLLSRPHHNLTSVQITLSHYSSFLDLNLAFPHLKQLRICARWVASVKVPDTLSKLNIQSGARVSIHVARPRVLAENLISLDVPYDEYSSPDVTNLLDAMESLGKKCTMVIPDSDIFMQEAAVYGEQVVQSCPCRACRPFLSFEGILDPTLERLRPLWF